MKRILALSALIASIGFGGFTTASAAEAKSSTASAAAGEPQIRVQIGPQRRNRNWRRARTYTRTRIVRRGYRTYRETYRITYLPNGRIRTRLISRVRIRG